MTGFGVICPWKDGVLMHGGLNSSKSTKPKSVLVYQPFLAEENREGLIGRLFRNNTAFGCAWQRLFFPTAKIPTYFTRQAFFPTAKSQTRSLSRQPKSRHNLPDKSQKQDEPIFPTAKSQTRAFSSQNTTKFRHYLRLQCVSGKKCWDFETACMTYWFFWST